ncbi:hypothetical protein QF027_008030 [Streptomyces canus]|nr:hypothetical protein [Streptomyces canus]
MRSASGVAPPFGGASFGIAASFPSRYRCRPSPCSGLSPARSTTAAPPHPARSAVDAPIPATELAARCWGVETGWFPCSLCFARRSRSPTVSLRHRHEYAVVLPRGLLDGFEIPAKKFPAANGGRFAPLSAQIRQVRADVIVKRRKDAGSSRAPLRPARRTRTIWQYWHVPALSGPLPPSPASPGSGCPQLHLPATTGQRRRSLTSTRNSEVDPERGTGLTTSPFLRVASRTRRAPLSAPGSPQVPWVGLHFMLCSAKVSGCVFPGSSSAWRSLLPDRTIPSRPRRARCRSVGVVPSKERADACAPAI